jgi:hypothetical protein
MVTVKLFAGLKVNLHLLRSAHVCLDWCRWLLTLTINTYVVCRQMVANLWVELSAVSPAGRKMNPSEVSLFRSVKLDVFAFRVWKTAHWEKWTCIENKIIHANDTPPALMLTDSGTYFLRRIFFHYRFLVPEVITHLHGSSADLHRRRVIIMQVWWFIEYEEDEMFAIA